MATGMGRVHEKRREPLHPAIQTLVLGLAAQKVVFIASGSVALLADLVHNFGDPLGPERIGLTLGSIGRAR